MPGSACLSFCVYRRLLCSGPVYCWAEESAASADNCAPCLQLDLGNVLINGTTDFQYTLRRFKQQIVLSQEINAKI